MNIKSRLYSFGTQELTDGWNAQVSASAAQKSAMFAHCV